MLALMKLHRKYLFNKKNIIIIILVLSLSFFLSIILIKPQLTRIDSWLIRESIDTNYAQIYLTFTKVIMIILSCCLFTIHFNTKNEEYRLLLLTNISRKKYYMTKVLTISIVIIIIAFMLFFNYFLIGSIFTIWFVLKIQILIDFVKISLLSIIYGLISLNFGLMFKNIYSVLIAFGIYFTREMLIDFGNDNQLIKWIDIIFPTFDITDQTIKNNLIIIHFGILVILYYLISYFIYLHSE